MTTTEKNRLQTAICQIETELMLCGAEIQQTAEKLLKCNNDANKLHLQFILHSNHGRVKAYRNCLETLIHLMNAANIKLNHIQL